MRRGTTAVATAATLSIVSLVAMSDDVAAACPEPFPAAFRTALTEQFAGQRVTASVYDTAPVAGRN